MKEGGANFTCWLRKASSLNLLFYKCALEKLLGLATASILMKTLYIIYWHSAAKMFWKRILTTNQVNSPPLHLKVRKWFGYLILWKQLRGRRALSTCFEGWHWLIMDWVILGYYFNNSKLPCLHTKESHLSSLVLSF
jgi:hypothetical protein